MRTAHCYLTAVDLPDEIAELTGHLAARPWAHELVVENDIFALLRAGTTPPTPPSSSCGAGINLQPYAPTAERARYLALGHISGDWGGGTGLAEAAIWAAARDEDGRGPSTLLRAAVLERSGLQRSATSAWRCTTAPSTSWTSPTSRATS